MSIYNMIARKRFWICYSRSYKSPAKIFKYKQVGEVNYSKKKKKSWGSQLY